MSDDDTRLFPEKHTSKHYNFNQFQEIKSHSSLLYNERVAILFYMLEMDSVMLEESCTRDSVCKVKARLYVIWKSIRTIVRNSISCRRALHLETKDDGIYTIDLGFGMLNRMFIFCENDRKLGFTYQRLWLMKERLNELELMIRDVLQYFQYFVRADFKQMPDILQAAENYKKFADPLTVDQLRGIVGKRNKIDFEGLGMVQEKMDDYDSDDTNLLETSNDDDEKIAEAERELVSDDEGEDGQ